MIAGSFLFFLLLFVLIGLASTFYSKKTEEDYLTTGQSTSPWLVALSAVATNNSGYMFIGVIGFTYTAGLSSFWVTFGFFFGDYLASLLIHKKLRVRSGEKKTTSFGHLLSTWQGKNFKKLRILTGLMTLIFLSIYAAAQFKAGSKALHVLFNWDYSYGAIIGGIIVLLYCLAGGMRASIWTDAAQSFVMILAMAILTWTAVDSLGGLHAVYNKLLAIDPNYLSLTPSSIKGEGFSALALFIIGWICAGFGVVGQPHIMMRFITLDNPQHMKRARAYYYSWYGVFSLLTIVVGLCARLLIPEANSFDAELALPTISKILLPEVLVGLILAGLFAATMSTADSQILSCSSAISKDIFPRKKSSLLFTKMSTIFVAIFSLLIALYGGANVFNLVIVAWSILAAAFAPLITLFVLDYALNERECLLVSITGVIVTLLWRNFGLSSTLAEVGPGMASGFIIYALCQLLKKRPVYKQENLDVAS